MNDFLAAPLVYDTGALLAAERNDRRMIFLHNEAMLSTRQIVVPAPVLAQAWRGGAGRQANLSVVLKVCEIDETSEQTAKAAGVLLGASSTSDAVGAIVVATALRLGAHVFTSDPNDLHKLADSASATLTMIVV